MTGGEQISIGDWTFRPKDGALVRGVECRRLEHRAAAVLQLLAERRGAIVNQQELIAAVWAGRAVSPNSVAITIADIRKALGDDARAPKFVETLPKRGYRLAEPDAASAQTPSRRRWRIYPVVGAAIAVLGLSAVALSPKSPSPPTTIAIADFENATRQPALDPLAESVHELAVTDLGTAEGLQILPTGSRPELTLRGKLIMWSGHPSVAISVEENSGKHLLWTGMAPGPEDALPPQMQALVTQFAHKLDERRKAGEG
jgi:DNA-binding winged helix-turn-helix (wHTH) protein